MFTVDEFQFLAAEEMEALIVALHRISQEALPVLFVGAGLPSLPGKVGDARSYAERLFLFRRINSLEPDQARAALARPAEQHGVRWTEGALDAVMEQTRGYPYFPPDLRPTLLGNSNRFHGDHRSGRHPSHPARAAIP